MKRLLSCRLKERKNASLDRPTDRPTDRPPKEHANQKKKKKKTPPLAAPSNQTKPTQPNATQPNPDDEGTSKDARCNQSSRCFSRERKTRDAASSVQFIPLPPSPIPPALPPSLPPFRRVRERQTPLSPPCHDSCLRCCSCARACVRSFSPAILTCLLSRSSCLPTTHDLPRPTGLYSSFLMNEWMHESGAGGSRAASSGGV